MLSHLFVSSAMNASSHPLKRYFPVGRYLIDNLSMKNQSEKSLLIILMYKVLGNCVFAVILTILPRIVFVTHTYSFQLTESL